MRLLYIVNPKIPDFQADMLFLGGRSLFGEEFVDINKNWYSYKEDKKKYWSQRIPGKDHGSGFTLHGKLDDIPVDRTDVEKKIKNRFFDYIIYGSINRSAQFLDLVIQYYPKNKIIIVDGEDDLIIRKNALSYGLYFKRELTEGNAKMDGIFPINFCLPRAYYIHNPPEKKKMFAYIIPNNPSTYIYGVDDEDKYHQDYKDSYFGVTMKKAGWDCNRHYEILINGCVPYFIDLEKCPKTTMVPFPKEKLISIRKRLDSEEYSEDEYMTDLEYILNYSKRYLTSEAMVEKLLSTVLSYNK